jgi:hypothetical protein
MRVVRIRVLKLKVAKLTPKDGSVELAITYSNESTKEILKTDKVVYPDSLARRILAEIRKTVRSAHKTFDNGELVEEDLDVSIDKEEQVTRQISHFLEEVRIKVEVVRGMKSADGYMDSVRAVQRMELVL